MAHAATPAASDGQVQFHVNEEPHHSGGTMLGFWLYLMSDCLIFAVLFATHAVVGRNYAAGPSPADLFDLKLILVSTFMLLFSSITYGFAMLEMDKDKVRNTILWLAVTFFFGACFLAIEFYEFSHLFHEGATPQRSAFLSSFFTLVGTHGLHVTCGLAWMIVLGLQIRKHGLIPENRRRLLCLSLFWHFLDVVWIGVFSFVYLIGVLL
jgi:cytochrome o ubiquinol oxidase subunit 3